MWGFIPGAIQKVETLILGTLGNLISKSYQEQFVLLWDIVSSLLNFLVNHWESICGISVRDAFTKLRPLSWEL